MQHPYSAYVQCMCVYMYVRVVKNMDNHDAQDLYNYF